MKWRIKEFLFLINSNIEWFLSSNIVLNVNKWKIYLINLVYDNFERR